jgi:hypothetical protein
MRALTPKAYDHSQRLLERWARGLMWLTGRWARSFYPSQLPPISSCSS